MTRTGRSLLVVGLLPIASLLAPVASDAQAESVVNVIVEQSAKPAVVAAPAAPTPPQEPKGVVPLPFRSLVPTRTFVDTAILRFVCPRSYSALRGGGEVACSDIVLQIVQTDERSVAWSFQRRDPDVLHTLELVAAPSPAGGYNLHLLGVAREASGKEKPNPELETVEIELEQLMKDLSSAPLGRNGDGLHSYQLSYVQADRAVAVLRTLGYPVVEYQKSSTGDSFEKVEPAKDITGRLLGRPVIVRMIDSGNTSLVQGTNSVAGGGKSALTGGQRMDNVTDGAPEQRLLIIYDENDQESLDALLKRLRQDIDVPARQLLIEALVIEIDRDRLLDLGVDLEGSKDNYGFSFNEVGGLIQPFIFSFDRPHPRTLLEFMAKLRALVDRGKATVLSRPSVFVLDGRQARIKVGDEIPYTTKLSVSQGVVTTDTAFLSTGIILNLRPRASSDNLSVTLQVETIISSPGPTRVLTDGVLVAPPVQSREVQTLVRVANDTPFVIGGLIAHTDQENITGIPGLSRIPGLGRLFRKENSINDRKEVIVVITPHIVEDNDSTYAYTIPRDVADVDAEDNLSRWQWAFGSSARHCDLSREKSILKPIIKTDQRGRKSIFNPLKGNQKDSESIFDSFDTHLFRNIYRLRSSDIFDLRFIQESPVIKQAAFAVQSEIGNTTPPQFIERSPSTASPDSGQGKIEEDQRDVTRRLREEFCKGEQCPSQEAEETLLTLFNGGVPGEEIFVQNMMVRLIERLGFSSCVPISKMILFSRSENEDLDPKHLTDEESHHFKIVRDCIENEGTVVMAFLPASANEALYKEFGEKCANLDRQPKKSNLQIFSPPSAEFGCLENFDDTRFIDKLRSCNIRDEEEGWKWQAILLNNTFTQRRDRNPVALLQSALALKRLLDLNDSSTLPRTIKDFHVGREIVFPTREDLGTRRHLIDDKTAQLFYETLDYYYAFGEVYNHRTKLRQRHVLTDQEKQLLEALGLLWGLGGA